MSLKRRPIYAVMCGVSMKGVREGRRGEGRRARGRRATQRRGDGDLAPFRLVTVSPFSPRRLALSPLSAWQALPRNHLHLIAKSVEFTEGRINIWSDAYALKLFVDDRGGKDSMLVEKVSSDGRGLNAFDFHVCYCARLRWIE